MIQELSDEELNTIFRDAFRLIDSRLTPTQREFCRAVIAADRAKRAPMNAVDVAEALKDAYRQGLEDAAKTAEGLTAEIRFQSVDHYKFAYASAAAIRALKESTNG